MKVKSDHRSKFSNLSNWKEEAWKFRASTGFEPVTSTIPVRCSTGRGRNRGVNLPSPYLLSQFLPPPYFFEPISPSSLNGYVSFSPSSLLFPPISPSSHFFLGHFSLLPILFLPPPTDWAMKPHIGSEVNLLTSHHFTAWEDMNSINWPRSQCVAS